VFNGIVQRTIFLELFKVFLMSLCALTGLLLLAGVFAEASKQGLSPPQILMIIPLLVPSTLPYTLPTTTLFATCVVYGRLAHDNEILAIKAAGVNTMKVVWPGLLLGILASAVTVGLYYRAIPRTQYLLRAQVISNVEDYLYGMLRRDGQIVHSKLNYEIYVKRVQGRKLYDAQFMRRDPSGKNYDIIARATEAELHVDLDKHQVLIDMRHCRINSITEENGYVLKKTWPVEFPDDFIHPTKDHACDMTWQEMRRKRRELVETLQEIELDLAQHEAVLALQKAPDQFAEHVRDRHNQKRHYRNLIRDIDVERQRRPALGLGCLCFVLVGCPVGIWFGRSDYLSAFITCFLPIVVIYYPLVLCGYNVARSGQMNAALAVWFANGVMAVIALGLFRRLLRH
jgi:lipopolysaccharide export system permease protein